MKMPHTRLSRIDISHRRVIDGFSFAAEGIMQVHALAQLRSFVPATTHVSLVHQARLFWNILEISTWAD